MYGGGTLYSKKREVRNKKQVWIYFLLGVFSAGGILAGLWNTPRYPQFLISHINVSGNNAVPAMEIENTAKQTLAGAFYIFFPKYNSLWYPKEAIEKNIITDNPRVAAAVVTLKDLKSVDVNVTERIPTALLCRGEKENPGSCLFMDENGFIFAEAADFTGSIYERFFSTTTAYAVGSQFISQSDFEDVNLFIQDLGKNGLNVTAVTISSDITRLSLDWGGEIIVGDFKNLGSATENLKTLLQSKEFKGKDQNGKYNFKYIDLRFGNKLFYKI